MYRNKLLGMESLATDLHCAVRAACAQLLHCGLCNAALIAKLIMQINYKSLFALQAYYFLDTAAPAQ